MAASKDMELEAKIEKIRNSDLTVREIQRLLSVSRNTAYDIVQYGQIRATEVDGKTVLFKNNHSKIAPSSVSDPIPDKNASDKKAENKSRKKKKSER